MGRDDAFLFEAAPYHDTRTPVKSAEIGRAHV